MELRQIIHLGSDFSDTTYVSDLIVYVDSRNESNVRSTLHHQRIGLLPEKSSRAPHLCHLNPLADLTANGWSEQHTKTRHLQGDYGKSDYLNNTGH